MWNTLRRTAEMLSRSRGEHRITLVPVCHPPAVPHDSSRAHTLTGSILSHRGLSVKTHGAASRRVPDMFCNVSVLVQLLLGCTSQARRGELLW